jgi:phage-related protein
MGIGMKEKQLYLRDKLETVGIIIFFMVYLAGAVVVTAFEKTKKTLNKKINQIQNKVKQRG